MNKLVVLSVLFVVFALNACGKRDRCPSVKTDNKVNEIKIV